MPKIDAGCVFFRQAALGSIVVASRQRSTYFTLYGNISILTNSDLTTMQTIFVVYPGCTCGTATLNTRVDRGPGYTLSRVCFDVVVQVSTCTMSASKGWVVAIPQEAGGGFFFK